MDKTYTNPISGDTLRFVQTGDETGGEVLEVEVTYLPAHARPVAHFHPRQAEHFDVLTGSIMVSLDGQVREVPAGETIDVPAGIVHSMWNAGSGPVKMRWETRPALQTQQFFETIWGLGQDGKLGPKGSPNLLQAAVLMRTYADVFRPASPPPAIQGVLFGVLAPVGRWLGYPAYYLAG